MHQKRPGNYPKRSLRSAGVPHAPDPMSSGLLVCSLLPPSCTCGTHTEDLQNLTEASTTKNRGYNQQGEEREMETRGKKNETAKTKSHQ